MYISHPPETLHLQTSRGLPPKSSKYVCSPSLLCIMGFKSSMSSKCCQHRSLVFLGSLFLCFDRCWSFGFVVDVYLWLLQSLPMAHHYNPAFGFCPGFFIISSHTSSPAHYNTPSRVHSHIEFQGAFPTRIPGYTPT